MLFHDNLEEIIFNRHLNLNVDELVILSGYIGPQPIKRLAELPLHCSVIYGMYGASGIGQKLHTTLQDLNHNIDNIHIMYSQLPVHAKCYVWKKNNQIVTALIGSANFSANGLCTPYREILAETTVDTFTPLNNYLELVINKSISCLEQTIAVKTPTSNQTVQDPNTTSYDLSLLDRSGSVPQASGLNWGFSAAHTTLGDAYIPIRKNTLKDHPLLFPKKQQKPLDFNSGKCTRQNDAIDLIWDDGTIMEGLLEGTQLINDTPYPKQICSSPRKNILGIYLRNRLNVSLDHLITKQDLENYGRTNIQISLQGEGIYYLDFSV